MLPLVRLADASSTEVVETEERCSDVPRSVLLEHSTREKGWVEVRLGFGDT